MGISTIGAAMIARPKARVKKRLIIFRLRRVSRQSYDFFHGITN
ncbi:hypothetical protein NUV25_00555 [Burkholderia pseudomultivorans]|nr:hypothetical protein [Burkholderia pseudomultivorans]MDS0856185.1 hypothetical protein [Burkholderia pseudomultivorans]